MEEIGKYIWLEDEEDHGWVPAKIIQILENCYILHANINDEIIEYEIKKGEIEILDVHTSCLEGVDDLLGLGDFNEPTLLQNTRARFYQDKIYSFIGSPILIAVNPYKKLDIYNDNFIRYFRDFFLKLKQDSNMLKMSVPHLYYVAEAAYQEMIAEKKNQSIVISGESGSGKTESTKLILKYLAVASEISNNNSNLVKNEESVEKQVLDSNPLLEAFGNAKTVKNNNSSRFGKFINVNFTEFGKIISAKIYNYLLEKSRIVKIQENERNYHIFFQLLYGANEIEKAKFMLKDPSYFNYLRHGCLEIEDTDDKANFIETKECMVKLKFSNDEIHLIFSVLVGILYLGNIEFINQQGAILITEETKEDFKTASEFIGLDQQSLLKILTIRKMADPLSKKEIDKAMNIDQVYSCRDTISKTLYARMFDWIIKKINNAISSNQEKEKNLKIKRIGILDIFGFEIFEENSFEQMCINYANERLQQFFNNHIFKMEQEEYMREKIDWSQVTFKDNKDIIELIDNPQKSIFALLDSQGFIKNTNDRKLKDTIYSNLTENKNLVINKKRPDSLIINHYAGEVEYNISGFIDKNDDQLNNDIIEAFEGSKNKLIKYLFKKIVDQPKKDKEKAGPNKLQSDSLSKQFKKQLDELIKMLSQSNPRYIKCIKPNNQKVSGVFESLDVNRQLLSAGVLESIKIRKQGYSIRRTHEEFVRKYLPLTPGIDISKKGEKFCDISLEMIKLIANLPDFKNSFNNNKRAIQVGLNKIFMKDEVKIFLESKLNQTYMQYIVKIQSFVKRMIKRKKIKKLRQNVIMIKKFVKGLLIRQKYQRFKNKIYFKHNLLALYKNIILKKLRESTNVMKDYLIKKRNELKTRNHKTVDIDLHNNKTGDVKGISRDKSQKHVSSKRNLHKANTNLNDSNSSKNKELEQLLSNIKGKKSKGRMEDLFKPQNEAPISSVLSSEYIAKIEILTKENDTLTFEKNKLNEEMINTKEILKKKEKELMKLRRKLNETGDYKDESLKNQLEYLDKDMTEKLKSDLEMRGPNKKLNNHTSEKNFLNPDDNIRKTIEFEEELRKYKKEILEKDSIICTLTIQLEEQTKNYKSISDLCDKMKNHFNRSKDKYGIELEELFRQKKDIEIEKNDIHQKKREITNLSPSPTPVLRRASGRNETDLKSKYSKQDEKKIEEMKVKIAKDHKIYENHLSLKEKKINEAEQKIISLEKDLKRKSEEFKNLMDEYNLCKEKIPDLKNKLDNIHKNKLSGNNNEINSMRESYEFQINKKTKEMLKFENEISDLTQTVEKMKKIESLLKDELFKKGLELDKANDIMKLFQIDNEKISEENLHLKRELTNFKSKRNSINDSVIKELETELKAYKHSVLLLEDEKNQYKTKIKREKEIIQNKSDQNFTMVDLFRIMKQQISLLQNSVEPTQELHEKFKELRTDENKVLLDLQKIAESQLSDSDPEYEEDEGIIKLILENSEDDN